MNKNDLYYLSCILRRLQTYRKIVIIPTNPPSPGSEALNDEIDWLDCFIDAHERKARTAIQQLVRSARLPKRKRKS